MIPAGSDGIDREHKESTGVRGHREYFRQGCKWLVGHRMKPGAGEICKQHHFLRKIGILGTARPVIEEARERFV